MCARVCYILEMVHARGMTLVEVMMAFILLALVAGSALVFFIATAQNSRVVEIEQDANVDLETVCQVARQRARQVWPDSVSVPDTPLGDNVYRVDDEGFIASPVDSTKTLPIKRIRVSVRYQIDNAQGKSEPRSTAAVLMVGQ